MSNDRKAVILGRLQRVTTVTPCPQASGPFHLLRSGRRLCSLDACTASRPPAGTGSPRKAHVSLSPVCGPYYTQDARPPAGHQQMLHTCSPSERAPFPGRDRAPTRVLGVRVGPHLPGAALGLPAALSPSVQSPSQIQPVPTLARGPLSPIPADTGRGRTGGGPAWAEGLWRVARGRMSWDAERRGRRDVCPGNLENFAGRSDQDAALGGTEGLVRDGGARRGRRGCDPVVRGSGSGTSPGEKRRAARVWKEGWTLVRGGDRRGWAGAACGRFGRVTLGAGGGRARAEFRWKQRREVWGRGPAGGRR